MTRKTTAPTNSTPAAVEEAGVLAGDNEKVVGVEGGLQYGASVRRIQPAQLLCEGVALFAQCLQ